MSAVCNVLVQLDASRACSTREAAAVELARGHDAHVRGLYCVTELYVPGWADWPPHVLEEHREQEQARAREVLRRFRETAEAAGVGHDERAVHVGGDWTSRTVALEARHHDMVVVGQPDPDDPTAADAGALVEHVVLAAGRPVCVVPYIGLPAGDDGDLLVGRHVMVAWDGGREATRALHDNLGVLERAQRVEVVTVDPERNPESFGDDPGEAITRHLADHGIHARFHGVEGHGLGPAEVLLNRIVDSGADLLVIGAYGHSRLRELILGGVTRDVLEQASVPVLMSH